MSDEVFRANFHRAQNAKGLIAVWDVTKQGRTVWFWRFKRDCVKRGEYFINGEPFPIGYEKIEVIMDRFGGKWWGDAIKERLGITDYSEMLDPKKKHLIKKYRELVDECLELTLTPEAKSPTPPINNQESFVF